MRTILFSTIISCMGMLLHAEGLPSNDVMFKIIPEQGKSKTLSISIPANFKQLQKQITNQDAFYEFIPENENGFAWSEIITIMHAPHKGQTVEEFLQNFEQRYAKNGEKYVHSFKEENGMKVAYFIARLKVRVPHPTRAATETVEMHGSSDKTELLTMKIISEKKKFSIIQCTARYANSETAENKEAAKQKCLNFLKSCQISN